MKFKIEQGTETYGKLMELKANCDVAHDALNAFLDELGATEYVKKFGSLVGGVQAVAFRQKPEGWKKSDWSSGAYEPKKANTEMVERIAALPYVPQDALNSIVGFMPQRTGLTRHYAPGIMWREGVCLLSVAPTANYTPPNGDIVEILESEYQRLAKEVEEKETKDAATA